MPWGTGWKSKDSSHFDLGEWRGAYVDKLIQTDKEGKLKPSDDNNTVVDTKRSLFTGGSLDM